MKKVIEFFSFKDEYIDLIKDKYSYILNRPEPTIAIGVRLGDFIGHNDFIKYLILGILKFSKIIFLIGKKRPVIILVIILRKQKKYLKIILSFILNLIIFTLMLIISNIIIMMQQSSLF